jgi:hypothetical protein
VSPVVSNQDASRVYCFDQVQKFGTVNFTENNVSNLNVVHVARFDGAELSGFDLSGHRRPARPELHGLSALKLLDVESRPAHHDS